MNNKGLKIFRWTLRVLSAIFILFFLVMFIGETFFSPESQNLASLTAKDIYQLILFAFIMIGLGLAWKWELTGGIIALVAFIGMAIINPNTREASLLLIYPAIAILFIVLWVISKNKTK